MINQGDIASENLVRDLLDDLAQVRSSVQKELTLGLGQVADELDNPDRLFECGWSWGVVDGAPKIDSIEDVGEQPEGTAAARPYMYFTVVALDGIQDLFSERTRILGLLTEEQQRLATALQLRWDLTRQFWAKIATFGSGRRWPMEDLPWTTSDGDESDYYSLLLDLDRHRGRRRRAVAERRLRAGRPPARGAGRPRPDHPQADHGRPGGRAAHPGHAAAAVRQREGSRGPAAAVDGLQLRLAGAQATASGG